ncbi:MAG: hypothetical protein E6R04_05150 [Spirochaetes bacterium]|nr:MAG: hypothetical protein E6R04_05150 [Spirochaetota bacterium]
MSAPVVGASSPYPRQVPPTLHIEGTVAMAVMSADGQEMLRAVRRALVTGGRGMLTRTPGHWFRFIGDATEGGIIAFGVKLTPEIEHRIRTSGGVLSEEEILTGMEQVRESDEDTQQRMDAELFSAYTAGHHYVLEQIVQAMSAGDDAALHRATETARKTMALGKQIRERAGRPA